MTAMSKSMEEKELIKFQYLVTNCQSMYYINLNILVCSIMKKHIHEYYLFCRNQIGSIGMDRWRLATSSAAAFKRGIVREHNDIASDTTSLCSEMSAKQKIRYTLWHIQFCY